MSTQANYSSSTTSAPFQPTSHILPASLTDVYLSSRKLLVLVFFLIIFTGAARPITDPDFWWHLKTGQYLLQTRTIPHVDIFSSLYFGKEWVTHEWLAEALMYSIYSRLGYSGLIIIFAAVITAAFFITYQSCRRRAHHPYVSGFALLLGAFATMPVWGVRPQMFTLLLASIFLAVLDRYARENKKRALYWLVPLTIIWVNLHAGFALGLALIVLTIVGLALEGLAGGENFATLWRRVRPLCGVWLVAVGAVVINPNGIRIYSYPFETLKSHAMMKYIGEWKSPDFHEVMFIPLIVLIFATFGVLALARKRVGLRELLLLMATGFATLRSARNVPFFALVAIPLLTEYLWEWVAYQRWGRWLTMPEKLETGRALKIVLNVVLMVLVPGGLVIARVVRTTTHQERENSQQFPVAAVDHLSSHKLPQPIFNEYGWGGYLGWRLFPDYPVYIDGRADVYGDAFLEEFLQVHSGEPNWQEPLNRNGVRTVLVKPDTPIASLLRQNSGWEKEFEDSEAVIFVRK